MALSLQNEPKHSYVGPAVSYGVDLAIFSPVQSTFELLLGKLSSAQAGGLHFGQPLSVRSRLLLTSDSTPYQIALLIT